jgi:26S proteasome regulatory subunit N1
MAKDDEKKPTAAEKGKGKAVDGDTEKKEVKMDKDGKPIEEKKGAPAPGMCGHDSCYHSM